jgi:ATP-dependent exoDNAse (exonuclease V) beta subunit
VENSALEQQRDRAESVRISYVAATRARDLLVIPTVGDEPITGWLEYLNQVIYPARAAWRNPEAPPPFCPSFGDRTVLSRPVRYDGLSERSVKPGLHGAEVGQHKVLWWDPVALELDIEPDFGLRQEEILSRPDNPADEQLSLQEYQEWQKAQQVVRTWGSFPERSIFRPSEAEQDPPGDLPAIAIERASRMSPESRGKRYGTLVHTVLRDLDWDSPDQIEALARFHGNAMQASPEEILDASRVIEEALSHPRFQNARAAEVSYREYPIAVKLDDGMLLEGSIDLLYRERERWQVIDFKTDRELASKKQLYERQLRWYVLAVSKLMGRPADGCLLVL